MSSIQETLRKFDESGYGETEGQPVQYVIVDLTPVSSVDSAACQALTDIFQEYEVLSCLQISQFLKFSVRRNSLFFPTFRLEESDLPLQILTRL